MESVKDIKKEQEYKDGGNFKMKIGNTTFNVGVFFNQNSKLSMDERIKNLIKKDVECGNY